MRLYGLAGIVGRPMGDAGIADLCAGVPVARATRLEVGDFGVCCGLGSSGPMILERCWKAVFLFGARLLSVISPLLDATEVTLGTPFDLVTDFGEGEDRIDGETGGGVGVGEDAFLRTLFAALLRNFSSSSEVASESLALKSILIATDSKLLQLLRELLPKDGARLRPVGKGVEPANVSERRSLRTLGLIAGVVNSSESFDIDEIDFLNICMGLGDTPEFNVVELGVDGLRIVFRS